MQHLSDIYMIMSGGGEIREINRSEKIDTNTESETRRGKI